MQMPPVLSASLITAWEDAELVLRNSPVPASLWMAERCATCAAVACRLMGPRSCRPSDLASAMMASIVSEKYLQRRMA